MSAQHPQPHATLLKIRATHELACGVVQEDAEYSTEDDHSSRGAFDEGLCRAYATAADPGAQVKITSFLDEPSALAALRARKLDVIASISADAAHPAKGVHLSRPVFYDSLALLVPVAGGAQKPEDLAGRKICVLAETGAEEALRSWFAAHRIDYLPFPFQEEGEMEAAYVSNNCAALAAERTRLSLIRLSLGGAAAQYVMLSQPLSQDPMASATRAGDKPWSAVIGHVRNALLLAEQLGLTADQPAQDSTPSFVMARFQSLTAPATALGLRESWALDVFRSTGSYGDLYERTLGSHSDRVLPRDLNRLHRDGGLLAPATNRALRTGGTRRSL